MSSTYITLQDVAGMLTEKAVWQMICDLTDNAPALKCGIAPRAITVNDAGHFSIDKSLLPDSKSIAFNAPETPNGGDEERCAAWTIGALAFYAVMGINVFEGKGGRTQTQETEVPRIGSTHASIELSTIIRKCLSYQPASRPTIAEIRKVAEEELEKDYKPNQRLANSTGKAYKTSIVTFWPEEMTMIICIVIMLLSPMAMHAQASLDIPNEMGNLVRNIIDLRSPANKGKVERNLERDTKWTMMDEIAVDKSGECTTKDKVTTLGVNSIGFRILKLHGGATNSGGRFRDGRDPRYKYSFLEITVKKGASVNYNITGRDGYQLFAIVPQNGNASYSAAIYKGNKRIGTEGKKDGVTYIPVKAKIKKNDTFRLSITNNSATNMSFTIINYNSRNNE